MSNYLTVTLSPPSSPSDRRVYLEHTYVSYSCKIYCIFLDGIIKRKKYEEKMYLFLCEVRNIIKVGRTQDIKTQNYYDQNKCKHWGWGALSVSILLSEKWLKDKNPIWYSYLKVVINRRSMLASYV